MKLASHNTFSYLPVRKWWMWPFAWMARCQRTDFWLQVESGVRMFDLRVRFDKRGLPVICHGLIEYRHGDNYIGQALRYLQQSEVKPYYIRVVLETSKYDERQEDLFISFCDRLEHDWFPTLYFFGGNNRKDWNCKHPIYRFSVAPEIVHKYASTTTLFPKGPKWLWYVDDLCPFLYARLHNHKNIEEYHKERCFKWLMLDFVDIR